MKNFIAIHSVHSDEAAEQYKEYFKTEYSEDLTHGEWAATVKGDFATAMQVWQGMKSDFYCTHFLAENEEQVFKQIEAWRMTEFFPPLYLRQNVSPQRLCLQIRKSINTILVDN